MDESSPLLNNTDFFFCDLDDSDERWPNCIPDQKNLVHFSDALKQLEGAHILFEQQTKDMNTSMFQNQLASNYIENIRQLKDEVIGELGKLGLNGLVQKVRVCGEDEELFRIVALTCLLLLSALAAWATYQLDKITSYKVS